MIIKKRKKIKCHELRLGKLHLRLNENLGSFLEFQDLRVVFVI